MIAKQLKTRAAATAVGYVRRSTDRQEQSIGDQKKALELYAQENGLSLSQFYVDDAISGTSTVGRRAFQRMLTDAQKPSRPFDCIIVYDVKRFGRVDNDEAGYYRHLLRKHGVEVVYISENFNGDATDDLLRPVKQWQARQESKDLSKVTIRGLLSRMPGGWWMGGVPPHGYDLRYENTQGEFLFILRFMPDGSKRVLDENGELTRTLARGESLNTSKRDHAKLIASEPSRVSALKDIFRMYAEQGLGFKSIANALNEKNTPTPRGPQWSHIYSGKWTDTTIRSILVNPIYVGDMVWNRRTDGRFHQIKDGRAVEREGVHGARLVPNDETDWIIVRDAHPALVSRRLFNQAKQRREDRVAAIEQSGGTPSLGGAARTWHGKRNRFILSGLMTCAMCGNRYQGLTRHKGKRRKDGSRVKTFYYGCGGHITKGNAVCQINTIPQEQLENAVIEAVLEFYRPYLAKDGRKLLAAEVKKHVGTEGQEFTQARRRAERELAKIDETVNNLLDNITATNRDLVDKRLKELNQRKQELALRLEEQNRLSISQGDIQAIVSEAMQFLAGLEHILRHGVPEEKQTALRQCVDRIHIDKPAGKINVSLRVIPTSVLGSMASLGLTTGSMVCPDEGRDLPAIP